MTLWELNRLSAPAFVTVLGDIFEHSPWVAERARKKRPFASIDALHETMVAAMRSAPATSQISLIRAHPELAGKAALRGELTADSALEQSVAGLAQCSADELARLTALNAAYNAKFGFPFIVCVRRHTRDSILQQFERRLPRSRLASPRRSQQGGIGLIHMVQRD
jgi:OHCU decarboxylase